LIKIKARCTGRAFHGRENIFQRIALAYLWEKESLPSDNFSYLFSKQLFVGLEDAAEYFWAVSGQPLSEPQKALIIDFWDYCATRVREVVPPPAGGLGYYDLDMISDCEARNRAHRLCRLEWDTVVAKGGVKSVIIYAPDDSRHPVDVYAGAQCRTRTKL